MSGKAELMVDKEIETIVAGSIVNIPKGKNKKKILIYLVIEIDV